MNLFLLSVWHDRSLPLMVINLKFNKKIKMVKLEPHVLLVLLKGLILHCHQKGIKATRKDGVSTSHSIHVTKQNIWKWKWKSLSHVQLFATPWTVARQASLSITNSQSLLKLMSFESVMPSNHLIPCHPLLNFLLFSSCLLFFTASGSYPVSPFFTSDGQSVGASASASVLPVNSHWFPLGLTGLISLKCKGLSRVFFNTTVQKHHFFGAKPSLWFNCHIRTRLLEKP